jgi:hypothetical protein
MDRRDFFRAATGAVAAAALPVPAPEPATVAALPLPDLTLYRLDPGGVLTPIGWFDQRRNDRIIAHWESGRVEGWTASAPPVVDTGNDGSPVPKICFWEGSHTTYGNLPHGGRLTYVPPTDMVYGWVPVAGTDGSGDWTALARADGLPVKDWPAV